MKREESKKENKEAGLMVIKTARLLAFAEKELIGPTEHAPAPMSYLAIPRRYNHAIIIIHGDGDPEVEVKVTMRGRTVTVRGSEFRVLTAAEEDVLIELRNTDPNNWRRGPRIEILSLRWREVEVILES